MLEGVRVVEFADELGEYCGLLLAGLGAEVIKVESREGSPTRRIGPFDGDVPHPERSLYFWAYNRGKRSVVLDLASPQDRSHLQELLATSDVLLDTTQGRLADALRLARSLDEQFPSLIHARLSAALKDEGVL